MEETPARQLPLLKNEFLAEVDGLRYRVNVKDEQHAVVEEKVYTFDMKNIEGRKYSLILEDRVFDVVLEELKDSSNGIDSESSQQIEVRISGLSYVVTVDDHRTLLRKSLLTTRPHADRSETMKAPMPGLVVRVEVGEGEEVRPGQGLIVLEAMKMENEIRAQHRGRVEKIYAVQGRAVEKGEPLLMLKHD